MWQSALTSCVGTRGRLPFPRSLQLASIFIISGTISRSLQLALKICDSFKKVGQWYCLVFLLYPEHSRCNDSFLLNSHQFLFFLPISKRHFSSKSHQFHYFCKGLPTMQVFPWGPTNFPQCVERLIWCITASPSSFTCAMNEIFYLKVKVSRLLQ